ncbi:hypothetical protein K491DRAFT_709319 [Lophiostoma macrostomum CBS 122681]|uniref:Aminoglycoside phosphotransferase domain-containing protein n=1 Tax=Lophiostoma macrostomum CBS 122681 TaxID=1314788 RepID=A0A6A6SHA4_9PLEO|nr:hypothetical protein K491DRAFT_709319 [Lophiostoma macrostomum CBS 122681]
MTIRAYDYDAQHEGSESLAINNTFIKRSLALLALHTTSKFFRRKGHCVPISHHKILKTGYEMHVTEAVTMRYIAEHTSIPVPKVYCSFIYKSEDLASALMHISKPSLEKILSQLKDMIQELRALETPPGTGIESCVGGSLFDSRIPHGTPRFGPFRTTQDLHALRFDPFNIIVSGDKVVAIIDWEFSGWYPPYWEYTVAWFGKQTRTGWRDMLHSILDAYPEELEIERTRNKWWGEW